MTPQPQVKGKLMEYEVQKSQDCEFDWLVSSVNDGQDENRDMGEIYVAVFSGPLSEERAQEYADWKNGKSLQAVSG